uniref:Peptidase S1 domain-containing protein n=1 Tax=Timema poppense TaxID=170557 RepID=A0A7R9CS58_TIMPO|nr:unnamed protein product [Timema poppensis]
MKLKTPLSGSILTTTWVITAGHCFLKLETPPNTVVVQAGVIKGDLNLHDRKGSMSNTNGQIRSARQIIVHPKFTTPNAPKDVALIEVTEPFRFSKLVTSIPLSPFQVLKGREKCIIAGYGSTGPQDRKFTRDLFWMNATINHKCEKNYKCVLHIPEGQRTASGDSGAPVMCKGYLSAIVKGSVTLDKDLNSTLVVQMSSLIPWLKTHIPKVMEEDILVRSASGEHGRQATGTGVVSSPAGILLVGLFFSLGCKRSLLV